MGLSENIVDKFMDFKENKKERKKQKEKALFRTATMCIICHGCTVTRRDFVLHVFDNQQPILFFRTRSQCNIASISFVQNTQNCRFSESILILSVGHHHNVMVQVGWESMRISISFFKLNNSGVNGKKVDRKLVEAPQ